MSFLHTVAYWILNQKIRRWLCLPEHLDVQETAAISERLISVHEELLCQLYPFGDRYATWEQTLTAPILQLQKLRYGTARDLANQMCLYTEKPERTLLAFPPADLWRFFVWLLESGHSSRGAPDAPREAGEDIEQEKVRVSRLWALPGPAAAGRIGGRPDLLLPPPPDSLIVEEVVVAPGGCIVGDPPVSSEPPLSEEGLRRLRDLVRIVDDYRRTHAWVRESEKVMVPLKTSRVRRCGGLPPSLEA